MFWHLFFVVFLQQLQTPCLLTCFYYMSIYISCQEPCCYVAKIQQIKNVNVLLHQLDVGGSDRNNSKMYDGVWCLPTILNQLLNDVANQS